jgi:hypothetical protein
MLKAGRFIADFEGIVNDIPKTYRFQGKEAVLFKKRTKKFLFLQGLRVATPQPQPTAQV